MISLKFLLEDIVKELRVSGDLDGAQWLVAYKDKVWLFPDEDLGYARGAIEHALHQQELETIDNVVQVAEEDPGVIVGRLQNKILYIYGQSNFAPDPRTSIALKKIVSQLKLKGVEKSTGDDSSELIKKSKIKGTLPDTVYHGTSSKYLRKILSTGLRAAESGTNYPNAISHSDLVFFTSRPDEAKYHAVHTVDHLAGRTNVRRQFSSPMTIPVILEMSIPDKDKVVPDFDVSALSSDEKPLSPSGYKALQKEKIPRQQSQETGIFGYRGRIPASFIKYVYVPKDWMSIAGTDKIHYLEMKDFKKMRPQAALKYIDKLEEYGY